MTKYEVLTKLNHKEIKSKDAYKLLFNTQKERVPRRAGFVKLKIRIPENKGISILLAVLFFLPIPIFIVKWIIKSRLKDEKINENIPLSIDEIIELISYRGSKINVSTNDNVKILIQTI